jgi:hypothetical protein
MFHLCIVVLIKYENVASKEKEKEMSLAGSQFKSFAAFKIGRVKIQNFTMPTPEEELDLQEQLATCMLNKSWLFTCISLIVSIPLSLRSKTYNPVVYCGLSGTMLDLLNGKLL